jgi:mono/diheme cytochrome c family protein
MVWFLPIVALLTVQAQAPPAPAPPAQSPEVVAKLVERGKAVYREQKCASCHLIGGVGNKRSVLDGVGSRLKPADVRQWIVAPRKMKATVRKPDYTKVPAADIDALVAYVMTLTKK